MKYLKYYLLTIAVILVDQAVKLAVYFEMYQKNIPEIKVLGEAFKLNYTTNPGMAFGLVVEGEYGKLFLTVFRLVAMIGIGFYLYSLAKRKAPAGLLWCMGLILGGAIGNVIDSIFYGVLLNTSPDAIHKWFHGEVIDMFYFDIWKGRIPEWFPIWKGEYTALWPIFNVADASIFTGVATILLFQRRFFAERNKSKTEIESNEKNIISGQGNEELNQSSI
ncbi:MAG: lipoprotein signal peptidase [Verrucomicrobia bacterium]|nr:lipoprotein signal peptidase [Cytophagales bacterium]